MPLTAIKKQDPEVNAALADEMREQEQNLELIASENYVSQTELEAQGGLAPHQQVR
jgi:glycine hydroxymethyltransferase